jgi:hypothetical protein
MTIAHHFSGGKGPRIDIRPAGTIEVFGTGVVGYFRKVPRGQILEATDATTTIGTESVALIHQSVIDLVSVSRNFGSFWVVKRQEGA